MVAVRRVLLEGQKVFKAKTSVVQTILITIAAVVCVGTQPVAAQSTTVGASGSFTFPNGTTIQATPGTVITIGPQGSLTIVSPGEFNFGGPSGFTPMAGVAGSISVTATPVQSSAIAPAAMLQPPVLPQTIAVTPTPTASPLPATVNPVPNLSALTGLGALSFHGTTILPTDAIQFCVPAQSKSAKKTANSFPTASMNQMRSKPRPTLNVGP